MKVVACDVDAKGLRGHRGNLLGRGAEVLAQHTDVTDYNSVLKLAEAAYERFGRVNLLFNNAGVLVGGILWERSLEDWRWNLDVNVMGVIHGIKAFVPRMIAGGDEGIVVNTASVGGLSAGPFQGPYITSKVRGGRIDGGAAGRVVVAASEAARRVPVSWLSINENLPFGTDPARQVWLRNGIVAEK